MMKIKQYLPEQDYDLPDIDVISLIFGQDSRFHFSLSRN